MPRYECWLPYEVERPWTDSTYGGCQYYYLPHEIVEAETPGKARAIYYNLVRFGWDYGEVWFIDIRVRVCRGSEPVSIDERGGWIPPEMR